MNEVLSTIARRWSCRAYDGRPVEKEKLEAIALAAVQSPSAMNRQPWRVAVVCDKALIDEMDAEGMRILGELDDKSTYERMMSRGGRLFYNAPAMFVIAMQPETGLDCGIVSENIALAAASLGLGSVICGMARIPLGGQKGGEFCRRLGIGEGFEFGMAVLVGYAKEQGKPHQPDTAKISYIG